MYHKRRNFRLGLIFCGEATTTKTKPAQICTDEELVTGIMAGYPHPRKFNARNVVTAKISTFTVERNFVQEYITLWGTVLTQISPAKFCFALKFGVVISQCTCTCIALQLQCSENNVLRSENFCCQNVFVVV